jgi:UDP-glucose:(heptosyl)LPS alpha-1,3-glucosyltransferase
MKIGLVRRGYSSSGGAEAYLNRFAQAAAELGHEPVLFGTKDWPKREWPHAFRKIKHGRSPLEFALQLATADPGRECDVLFSLERVLACDCFRAGDGVHAAWLERRAEYEPRWRTWWRDRQDKHHELLKLEETLFRGEAARAVIANSRMVKDEIVRHFGYPEERIHVIYNGVPPALSEEESARARQEIRAELSLSEWDYVVLFAGSGWDRKGLKYAIKAMNEAALSKPLLLVAGRGRERQMARSSRTRYLGPVTDLGRYFAAADAFILPTLYEPFSNACLEAMSAGLPVITTSANGFAEILKPGVTGEVLEDPRDTGAVAQAIERWAAPDLRRGIREQLCKEGAAFSVDQNVRRTLAVLEGLRKPPQTEPQS